MSWDIIPKIATPLSLLALLVASFFWYLVIRERAQTQRLKSLPETAKPDFAEKLASKYGVPVKDLSRRDRMEIVLRELSERSKSLRRITLAALSAFCISAIAWASVELLSSHTREGETPTAGMDSPALSDTFSSDTASTRKNAGAAATNLMPPMPPESVQRVNYQAPSIFNRDSVAVLSNVPPDTAGNAFIRPEAFRVPEIRSNRLPHPYSEYPRTLRDWLQIHRTWVYYRYGLYYRDQLTDERFPCSPNIRVVGDWNWDWKSGLEVVCIDDQWLAFDVGELYRREILQLGNCARSINIRSRPPEEHWGLHGSNPSAPELYKAGGFLSVVLNSSEENADVEFCERG